MFKVPGTIPVAALVRRKQAPSKIKPFLLNGRLRESAPTTITHLYLEVPNSDGAEQVVITDAVVIPELLEVADAYYGAYALGAIAKGRVTMTAPTTEEDGVIARGTAVNWGASASGSTEVHCAVGLADGMHGLAHHLDRSANGKFEITIATLGAFTAVAVETQYMVAGYIKGG